MATDVFYVSYHIRITMMKGNNNMTKLPQQLQQMYHLHFLGMTKVVDWLEKQGLPIFYRTSILQTTKLDICIRHDNDYIEIGPHISDPDGKMFHVYTTQTVAFDVPCEKLSDFMKTVKQHQSIGKKRIAPNIEIRTDVTNQFTMQKHIFTNDYDWDKMEIRLEFRIYHEFKEDS